MNATKKQASKSSSPAKASAKQSPKGESTTGITKAAARDGRDYLTEVDVADLFSVSTNTLRVWRCLGKGPRYCKCGRLVRYRLADCHRFMAENTRG